jgi:glycerol kinase
MAANDWLCQFLADLLGMPVERPEVIETTALGAACLAALKVGLLDGLDTVSAAWRSQRRFEPRMEAAKRDRLYAGWRDAVARVRVRSPGR